MRPKPDPLNDADATARPDGRSRKPLWRRRPVTASAAILSALGTVALLAGFIVFSLHLPPSKQKPPRKADGIVALTGDAERVRDALALLAAGRAQRLLITGVNPTTTRPEIAAANPEFRYLFQCCIDLGYEALNTVGNAVEARDWADRQGYKRSLIVVTSTYHMPRALAEMQAAMPEMTFIPYPVDAPVTRDPGWWSNLHALRMIGREYVKYLVAIARMAVQRERAPPAGEPTRLS